MQKADRLMNISNLLLNKTEVKNRHFLTSYETGNETVIVVVKT